ncbi:MAG: adenylate/guanylate cyclase domain-containing protein [Candidatus Hinthialibacter antarcticus]|nr:adenylate/guanylate cyclase domain-containing protein [Candidatus Hinthialibacter antarcticus]
MRDAQSFNRSSSSSNELEDRLKKALETRDRVEQTFRDENQQLWTIIFIDVSSSANDVWKMDSNAADAIFADYQSHAREGLLEYGPTFIDPTGGPQIIACFDTPEAALKAAESVLKYLDEWNDSRPAETPLKPAFGIHQGYVVYKDGALLQSNTANMAARVKSKAQPGQILVSSQIYKILRASADFEFKKIGTFDLKNIPEPQDLYQAYHDDIGSAPVSSKKPSIKDQLAALKKDKVKPVVSERHSHDWAMVYIDVCGSTKKFWSYGDREATRLIEEYQKICNKAFTSQGCEFLRSCEGDQIIAGYEVDNIDRAAVAAIQILQSLFKRNMTVRDVQKVQAAIGIHVGEVVFQGSELLQSKDMRIGKSTQSKAESEEILITQATLEKLHPDLHQFIEEYDVVAFDGLPDQYALHTIKWSRTQLNSTYLRKLLTTMPRVSRPKYK